SNRRRIATSTEGLPETLRGEASFLRRLSHRAERPESDHLQSILFGRDGRKTLQLFGRYTNDEWREADDQRGSLIPHGLVVNRHYRCRIQQAGLAGNCGGGGGPRAHFTRTGRTHQGTGSQNAIAFSASIRRVKSQLERFGPPSHCYELGASECRIVPLDR